MDKVAWLTVHDGTRGLGRARIGDDLTWPNRTSLACGLGVAVMIGARNPASVIRFGMQCVCSTVPSSVGQGGRCSGGCVEEAAFS